MHVPCGHGFVFSLNFYKFTLGWLQTGFLYLNLFATIFLHVLCNKYNAVALLVRENYFISVKSQWNLCLNVWEPCMVFEDKILTTVPA